ncbi:MAG: hypothetical protein K0S32_272 [Bacteroidetes bacterium]|jgi:uncharacterized protein (DUF1330 family)|nr:hypothetical protein [Bacteroidota bacterium]
MPAYVIVEIDIHEPAQYEEYKRLTPASIAAYNGRFVIRGGKTETLEGDWKPKRVVVLEFADLETAKKWWDSPEYAPAKALRQRIATTDMIVVEGAG